MAGHSQVAVDEEGLVLIENRPLWRRWLDSCCPEVPEQPSSGDQGPRLSQDWATIKTLLPYLWPAGELWLRVSVVFSLLCLLAAKVCDQVVPIIYRDVITALTPTPSPPLTNTTALADNAATATSLTYPLGFVIGYGLLKLGSTLFANMRDAAFIRVTQHAIRTLALETFVHLHRLSLRFHLTRRTGGVLRAIERGNSAISTLLTFVLFNILPTLLDIVLTSVILLALFGGWFAVITLSTVAVYVTFTIVYSEYRNKLRRLMNEADSDANNKAVDSLLNFETVKYFSNEPLEADRYNRALLAYQSASVVAQNSLALLNVGQSAIICCGLIAVMSYSAWLVVDGGLTVADLVALNVYILQLYTPLNFLGTSYRMIRSSIVDMESMFALLANDVEVQDGPDARPLRIDNATITFDNVRFAYQPENGDILRGISFTVPGGRTLAIVGSSGAGKSTIARLLFRFYDVTAGRILVDGQNIADLQQHSLRSNIGIVPQDTVLFNDTIEYNISYGRPGASQAQIRQAASAARIDHFIDSLPDGYDTKVGERGLRLSGGEKQRVSIARCLLQNPPILVLDEATSALDTATEREIQASLEEISVGRTTIVIAHRLSTVVNADSIIVLHEGQIAEQGSHQELLQRGGLYAEMWRKQLEEANKHNDQDA